MKHLIALILIAGSSVSHAGEFATWRRSVAVTPKQLGEMGKFSYNGAALSETFKAGFVQSLNDTLFARADAVLAATRANPASVCKPATQIQFMKAGFLMPRGQTSLNATENAFENTFMRAEATYCLQSGTPDQAGEVFISDDYRLATVPKLEWTRSSRDVVCDKVGSVAAIVSQKKYCARQMPFETPDQSVVSYYNDMIVNEAGYGVIYDIQGLSTFIKTPVGTVVHLVVYFRSSDDLGPIDQALIKKGLEGAQGHAFEELERRTP